MSHGLSHAGRHSAQPPRFSPRRGGTGLGGIALATQLTEQRLLANDRSPIRPAIDPNRPYAPRKPPAKAKRMLMLFCSGTFSHADSFDYKPELGSVTTRRYPAATFSCRSKASRETSSSAGKLPPSVSKRLGLSF